MKQRKGFYSDGKLRWEGTFVDVPGSTSGVPHGVQRHWHPNGNMAN
jgi:hypothetical protein